MLCHDRIIQCIWHFKRQCSVCCVTHETSTAYNTLASTESRRGTKCNFGGFWIFTANGSLYGPPQPPLSLYTASRNCINPKINPSLHGNATFYEAYHCVPYPKHFSINVIFRYVTFFALFSGRSSIEAEKALVAASRIYKRVKGWNLCVTGSDDDFIHILEERKNVLLYTK